MQDIRHFLELWNLSAPHKIASTPTSEVYKVIHNDKTCALKIYTDLGRSCESDAPYFFQQCDGQGTARMLNFNDQAILMEYIEGSPLKELVIQGKDEEATHIIGQTITKIHSAPKGQAHQFETLEHRFEALFAHAKKDAPDIIKRAAMFAKDMLNNQKDIRLLHGDIHHENIMQRSNSEWVAIDPQPLIGDRAYDCANTLHNPHQMPHKTESKERLLNQATIVSKITGLNKQQIIDYAFIHGCLSACWSIDDQTGTFSNSPAIKTSEILEGSISKNLS